MEYIKYLSRPYSKWTTPREFKETTGLPVSLHPTFERECREVFLAANAQRRVGEYLTATFPTVPEESEVRLHLLGCGACTIPLTEDNRTALVNFLGGEETEMLTNRGVLPCSTIQNRVGLRRSLEASRSTHLLFNGF